MDFTPLLSRLFAWVLHNEMEINNVTIEDVIQGIKHMNDAYKHNPASLSDENAVCASYETSAFRCAYLHKYATLHAALVSDITQRVIHFNYNDFHNILTSTGCLNLCSLGGGPGSDVVGMMLALHFTYGLFPVTSNIVDCMPSWNATFNALLRETQEGGVHGPLRDVFSKQYFRRNYVGANLLEEFSEKVKAVISSADVVNMVKFISAATCVDTESMVKRIFELMKPGAIVFFVDNSVGDIKFIMTKVANECKMESMLGPINHEHYINPLAEMLRFGYFSCHQTKIAIQVWKKPITEPKYIANNQTFPCVEKLPLGWMQSTPIVCKRRTLLSPQSSPGGNYESPCRRPFNDDSFFEDSYCSPSSSSSEFQISSPECCNTFYSTARDDSLRENFSDLYSETSRQPLLSNPHSSPISNLSFAPNSNTLHNLSRKTYFENSFDDSQYFPDSFFNNNASFNEFSHSVSSTPFDVRQNGDSGYWSPYSPYIGENNLNNQNRDNKFSHPRQISHFSNHSPVLNRDFSDPRSLPRYTPYDFHASHYQVNNFYDNFKNFYSVSEQHTSNKMRTRFHSDKSKRNAYSISSHNKENVSIAHSFKRNCNRNQRFHPYWNKHGSNRGANKNKPSSQLFRGRLF